MRCTFIFGIVFLFSQLSAFDVNAQQHHSSQRTRPVRFAQVPAASSHSEQPYYPQQQYPTQQYPQQQYPTQQYPTQQYPLQPYLQQPQYQEPIYGDGMIFNDPSNGLDNNWVAPDSGWTSPGKGVNEGNWASDNGRSNVPGQFPFLLGNIFGLSSDECCDEWADHCRCLELTNLRSNCECTNPHRTRQRFPEHSLDSTNSSDDRFDRTASRKTVSDYFHPRQYR